MNGNLSANEDHRKGEGRSAYHLAVSSTCMALRYTLEVICLSWFEGYARIEAQKEVAKRHSIAKETVMDAFSKRHGGVPQKEFDRLLVTSDLAGLKKALLHRFKDDPQCNNTIRGFICELRRFDCSSTQIGSILRQFENLDLETQKEFLKN